MWLMTRMAIIFYITILWATSLAVILFVFHVIDLDTINHLTYIIYNDQKVGWIVAAIAAAIILTSILLENIIYGRRRRERTIAFDNPSGTVIVSLSALEDLIKCLTNEMPQIKEIRPFMRVTAKKGLQIEAKLILRAQVNIPDLTAHLQELIRRRIEEVIGMEGKVSVRVHVTKIHLEEVKSVKRGVDIDSGHVPFHGYRA